MTIRRWDPTLELRRMEDYFDRLWSLMPRPGVYGRLFEGERCAPMDVFQTADAFVIRLALPGIKPDDVTVNIEGNTLTVQGEVRPDTDVKDEDYLIRERRFGSFLRSVQLPGGLDVDKVQADYRDGILTITAPKREEMKPRAIPVRVTVESK